MKNKVVIITGASSGIGKACAEEFALRGARVVIAARNDEKLQVLSNWIKSKGTDVLAIKTDVSEEEECKNLIEKTIERYGNIDILVNNAGISMRAVFDDTNLAVIKKLMDVNFWGTVFCTKYALPHLLKTRGTVAGVSSIAGYIGLPGRTGYSASKFAMHGFLEALRTENLNTGLHVLLACPGFTATNIRATALNQDAKVQGESPRDETKMMTAEEVAKKIVKAIMTKKRTLVLTSQGKLSVFLNKFFPGLMDRIIYKHMAKETDSPLK